MPSSDRRRETRVLRGIGFIVSATAILICMNTCVKWLSPHVPAIEMIWARSLGHLLFVGAIFAPTHGGWRLVVTRSPRAQVARSLLLLASTSFFFTGIGHVPLADATTVSFTAPFVVAALAGPVLGERVDAGHWVAIALGFCGAVLIIRPAGAGMNPYALLLLGNAVTYAGYQILTRQVAAVDPPETTVVYSVLVGTVVLSLVIPFYWQTPARLSHALVLASLGLFGGLGHYFVARAFLWAPASIVSPFHYVQLLWATVAGYLVFGDLPGARTWTGAAVIIASGLYIAWREVHRPRPPRVPASVGTLAPSSAALHESR
jgi:drug/metabolite transporter (DMT)-like permease